MPLKSSGPISLAGSVTDESISLMLGKSPTTGQISLNDTDVRTLAGIPTGAIGFSDFLGISNISPGQSAYTSAGTYSWVCPANITRVSVVCVGAGAGQTTASWNTAYGGGGGGLGWINNISVTPGQSYTVVVAGAVGADTAGGDSYFISTATVKGGGGGQGGNLRSGGTYTGEGGGTGGTGGLTDTDFAAGGGGGAGGYGFDSTGGNGGLGNRYYGYSAGINGTGGGGGGGAGSAFLGSGGGGGVGLLGQGSGGIGGDPNGGGGTGGSGGSSATSGQNTGTAGAGGAYGGGAGGKAYNTGSPTTSSSGGGAVRIIWGNGRKFPSTQTQNL